MRNLNITTADDLDAALIEQREASLRRLRRSYLVSLWANGLLTAAITLTAITCLREHSASLLVQCAVLVGFLWLTLWSTAKRRRKAARQLEEESRGV